MIIRVCLIILMHYQLVVLQRGQSLIVELLEESNVCPIGIDSVSHECR
uniref:Uncharacterized protein n=1 Tax=Enterobacter cloacae TaxID=550 RepID=A0A0H3ZLY9_ENTCL|nr:hypothetical protein [Enterobacter cloacae]AKN35389.1 hypothetical protein [Enterobacter cloacae]AKN35453.1 hypothetical protein [Enterobacter cloacae]AKN35487.1 hypothetical protein [Enterobacter cloacae]AOW71214.1 hypothetical protein [Enterobacter cloacae]